MPIELLWLLPPWALAFVCLGRRRRCPPLTARLDDRRVSVIIPARNEEARPPLLASRRVQDHPDMAIFTRSLHLTLVRNSVRWKGRSIPVRATG
jgi:4,4'-diaponeurosporenoate glycosyltransferase